MMINVLPQLLVLATFCVIANTAPVASPQIFPLLGQGLRNRPLLRPGGIVHQILAPHAHHHHHDHHNPAQPQPVAPVNPQPVAPAPVAAPVAPPADPSAVAPQQPVFTPGAPTGANNNGQVSGLLGMLNGGQLGNASAGGAGNGAVKDGAAIGTGTGIANAGPGGFGIGLGIGGAIATPLGNLAFGQGDSISVGK